MLLIACIGLPLFYACRICRLDELSILGWLLVVDEVCVCLVLMMLVGRWDIAGCYLQFVMLAVIAVSVVASFIFHVRRPCNNSQATGLSEPASHGVFAGRL